MKLLFCMEHLYPLVGGAEISVDTLIRAMEPIPDLSTSYLCSSNVAEYDTDEVFRSHDVIVTQLNWSKKAIDAARLHGKRSIQFVRSLEGFCAVASDAFAVSHCGQRCAGCFYRHRGEELAIPDILIANSQFTKRMLKTQYGLESEIVFPFIDSSQVRVATKRPRYITMNQFAYHKGADIFLKIAAALPELPFRIVGSSGWMPAHTVPPNVEIVGPVPSGAIYEEALIFLAPSRITETFGRCVVEAQLNGIPVLASDRGGPKYDNLVLPDYRIEEIDDIEPWVERIRWILENMDAVSSEVGQRDFSFCSAERAVASFIRIIRELENKPQLASLRQEHHEAVSFI